jgi:macrodomain Ter protein organizer (MatP/YcbG family)
VPIDLDNDTMLKLCLEAHKRDITLNEMVEILLREAIAEYDRNRT